ncbi:hypothetical protein HMPREF3038_01092 [Akkermansia sp. KLE1797]|nr:hypothetical protein HMPREF3038_01092 [Akkermansia sp. KLE1797]
MSKLGCAIARNVSGRPFPGGSGWNESFGNGRKEIMAGRCV